MHTIFDYLANEIEFEYESEYDSTLKKIIQPQKSTLQMATSLNVGMSIFLTETLILVS
jgi:hypothetical protein